MLNLIGRIQLVLLKSKSKLVKINRLSYIKTEIGDRFRHRCDKRIHPIECIGLCSHDFIINLTQNSKSIDCCLDAKGTELYLEKKIYYY